MKTLFKKILCAYTLFVAFSATSLLSQAGGEQDTTNASSSIASLVGERYGSIEGAMDAKHNKALHYKTKRSFVSPVWFAEMGDESAHLTEYQEGFAKGYIEGYRSPDPVLFQYEKDLAAAKESR